MDYICYNVQAVRTQALYDLIERARIPVEEAANLYGVTDETNTLEPTQVFVQVWLSSL